MWGIWESSELVGSREFMMVKGRTLEAARLSHLIGLVHVTWHMLHAKMITVLEN